MTLRENVKLYGLFLISFSHFFLFNFINLFYLYTYFYVYLCWWKPIIFNYQLIFISTDGNQETNLIVDMKHDVQPL
jgi:hypothetical protein